MSSRNGTDAVALPEPGASERCPHLPSEPHRVLMVRIARCEPVRYASQGNMPVNAGRNQSPPPLVYPCWLDPQHSTSLARC